MSERSPDTNSELGVMEALPGEKIYAFLLRAVQRRIDSGKDIELRLSVMGKEKIIIVTVEDTFHTLSAKLQ